MKNKNCADMRGARSSVLIPGFITVVSRDRNTNAVSKSSLFGAKKFITRHNRSQERACVALIFNLFTIRRADEIFRARSKQHSYPCDEEIFDLLSLQVPKNPIREIRRS